MKKIISIILITLILFANWCIGYSMIPSFWFGILWILIGVLASGIGAIIGIFVMNSFKSSRG